MRVLRRPDRVEASILKRTGKRTGIHRVVSEKHRPAEFHRRFSPRVSLGMVAHDSAFVRRGSVTLAKSCRGTFIPRALSLGCGYNFAVWSFVLGQRLGWPGKR